MNKQGISEMNNIKRCWKYAQGVPSKEQISGIHGISHWKKVEEFGHKMAESDLEIDITIVSLFACFHDYQRTDNGRDFTHGPRAAEAIAELRDTLLSFLTDKQFSQLTQACREHTTRTTSSGDITIDTCIDADRLDLTRVNITPDPDKMLSEKGKEMAAEIAQKAGNVFNGNIIQHIEQNILSRCSDIDLAVKRINTAVKEAELRKLDTLKMFVISSYACLPKQDIFCDTQITNWFTNDEIKELQQILDEYKEKQKSQSPFVQILNQIFYETDIDSANNS